MSKMDLSEPFVAQTVEPSSSISSPSLHQSRTIYMQEVAERGGFVSLSHRSFEHVLPVSCVLQFCAILLVTLIAPHIIACQVDEGKYGESNALLGWSIVAFLEACQLTVLVLAMHGVLLEIRALFIRPQKIFMLYLASILAFCGLNFMLFLHNIKWYNIEFNINAHSIGKNSHPLRAFANCFYLSAATMTHTGWGDVYPTRFASQFVAFTEQAMGVAYNIFIFTLALNHFNVFARINTLNDGKLPQNVNPSLLRRIIKKLRSFPWIEKSRKFSVKFLLLVVLTTQITGIWLLLLIDPNTFNIAESSHKRQNAKAEIFYVCFCFLQFLFVMATSFRLVAKFGNHEITLSFLAQSYTATVLLFGSVYSMLFVFEGDNMFGGPDIPNCNDNENGFECALECYWTFTYFAFSSMTSTGFGDVYTQGELARVIVAIQVIVNVLYTVVIFGLGMTHIVNLITVQSKEEHQTRLNRWSMRLSSPKQTKAKTLVCA